MKDKLYSSEGKFVLTLVLTAILAVLVSLVIRYGFPTPSYQESPLPTIMSQATTINNIEPTSTPNVTPTNTPAPTSPPPTLEPVSPFFIVEGEIFDYVGIQTQDGQMRAVKLVHGYMVTQGVNYWMEQTNGEKQPYEVVVITHEGNIHGFYIVHQFDTYITFPHPP